jgi:hypothetical protein
VTTTRKELAMKQTAKQLIREIFSSGYGVTVQELNKDTRFNHLDRARRLVIEEEPHKYRKVRIKPDSGRSYWVYFQNRVRKVKIIKSSLTHLWYVYVESSDKFLYSKPCYTRKQAEKLIKKCGKELRYYRGF